MEGSQCITIKVFENIWFGIAHNTKRHENCIRETLEQGREGELNKRKFMVI